MNKTANRTDVFHTLENLRNLPSIPKIMYEVSTMVKGSHVDNIQLAKTIGKDQGLTTKLLRVANSPMYGLQRKVSSLEFAVLLLGAEEISDIVTAISLSEAIPFRGDTNFKFMDYWTHSMIVGTASRDISRRLGMTEISGDAFLSGMLHDLGLQLMAKYFNEEYKEINRLTKSEGIKFLEAEKLVLDCTHQEIGRFLANKWELPENLCDVLEFHHVPGEVKQNPLLVSIVHLADCMTKEFMIANTKWDNEIEFDLSVSELLGFNSVEEFNAFIEDYKDSFADAAESVAL